MKVPSNVVRCSVDNGPIVYPTSPGTPYHCKTCREPLKNAEHTPGTHWEESYGFLVEVETEDDPRDTEEEVADLYDAIRTFASILGDGLTACHVAGSFTCSEADEMARALMVGDQKRAAITFLEQHALGDDDEDDTHPEVKDFEAYVLELAGQSVPELVDLDA
ncbi:hypothetical protein KGG72_gp72 [Streptomyces phage Salutena]|uniref:Uncharacterized protein n=1 Tax=Streptomyces phage Salutena TaxID=2767576 RepID=A0A7S6R867_9CAUD|nr:hypothetical protein KGG72_gp72 [Streptomyces phage Salutena]QOV06202.1 hypothetical protein CPT_Salutena_072 [Streptomyces phage Salutena]